MTRYLDAGFPRTRRREERPGRIVIRTDEPGGIFQCPIVVIAQFRRNIALHIIEYLSAAFVRAKVAGHPIEAGALEMP